MNIKQRKALEAKAQKKIKAIMRKQPLFKEADITISFKNTSMDKQRST